MIFLAIYKITNCWWIPINSHHIPSAYPLFFFTESLSRNEDSLLRLRLRDLLHLRCRCRRGWDRRLGRPRPRRRRGPWRCRVAWAWRFEGKTAENHGVLPWKLEVSCSSSSKSSSMKIQGWWMNGLKMKHARLCKTSNKILQYIQTQRGFDVGKVRGSSPFRDPPLV